MYADNFCYRKFSVFGVQKFDYLVNNAGIGIHASFADTTPEGFDTLMNIHFKGGFFMSQKALPLLNDGGGIVNISTGLSRFSSPGYAAYASMKGAMETLTKYQAKELGARGIAVNIVAPGAFNPTIRGYTPPSDPYEINNLASAESAASFSARSSSRVCSAPRSIFLMD